MPAEWVGEGLQGARTRRVPLCWARRSPATGRLRSRVALGRRKTRRIQARSCTRDMEASNG
eukprot:9856302-Alexandrium_andersonii.AAC.1